MSGALSVIVASGGIPGFITTTIPDAFGLNGASISIKNDGTYSCTGISDGLWVTPASTTVAALYQVKCDVTSGGLGSGVTGTWLDCSSTRTFQIFDGGVGATVTFTFREKASQIVRSTITGVDLTDVS